MQTIQDIETVTPQDIARLWAESGLGSPAPTTAVTTHSIAIRPVDDFERRRRAEVAVRRATQPSSRRKYGDRASRWSRAHQEFQPRAGEVLLKSFVTDLAKRNGWGFVKAWQVAKEMARNGTIMLRVPSLRRQFVTVIPNEKLCDPAP